MSGSGARTGTKIIITRTVRGKTPADPCRVSFALYALKYTGILDILDQSVFWTNVVAESLQPALFLHFALTFPEERLKRLAAAFGDRLGFRAAVDAAGGAGDALWTEIRNE